MSPAAQKVLDEILELPYEDRLWILGEIYKSLHDPCDERESSL